MALECFFQLSRQTQQKSLLHLEHRMWLHPSFFWMGEAHVGHGLECFTSHRKFAASFVSSAAKVT